MRNLELFEEYRKPFRDSFGRELPTDKKIEGKFHIPIRGIVYEVKMSRVFEWEHLSVTVYAAKKGGFPEPRIANPDEVEMLKKMFFHDFETAIEVHPKKSDYVNINPYTLHLWRRFDMTMPTPPKVAAFSESDIIDLENPNLKLLIKSAFVDGWDGYEISVLKNGKPMKRQPSWNEMCTAKRFICGENEFAVEFHFPNSQPETISRTIWLPPKTIDFPLPEPFLVGIRNEADKRALMLKDMTFKEKRY